MPDADGLDEVIHQRHRLRIMGLLYRNRQAPYTFLRDTLGVTDGNLSTHLARLQREGYLSSARVLTPRGFEVHYRITPEGSAAFRRYLDALTRLLAEAEPPLRVGRELEKKEG